MEAASVDTILQWKSNIDSYDTWAFFPPLFSPFVHLAAVGSQNLI